VQTAENEHNSQPAAVPVAGVEVRCISIYFPKHDFFTSVLTLDRLQGDGNADEVARERAFNAEQEQEQEQEQGWYI